MKNIKTKRIGIKKNFLYPKIFVLTIIMLGIGIIGIQYHPNLFTADSIKKYFSSEIIINEQDNIKENSFNRPFNKVTKWSSVEEYYKIQYTNWDQLDESLKTNFPSNVSDIMNKYKYVSPYDVWNKITNPQERELVLQYKRLITTGWSSSYSCGNTQCNWWLPETGTHAGVDFISSINTPIYSIGNGIILEIEQPCPGNNCNGFGNYILIATNYNDELYGTFYAHMNSVNSKLKKGDIIKKGELIGYLGNTGNSTAPHLHLQINKLGKISNIKNIDIANELFQGWFHNLEGVKEKTVNPISFIENSRKGIVDDGFQQQITINQEINNQGILDDINENQTNIVDSSIKKEKFLVKEISLSKIDTKLKLNDEIKLTINTIGEDGKITITTSNNVIKPSIYEIIPKENQNQHIITLKANQAGDTSLHINDGNKKESLYFSVYNESIAQIYGLKIEGGETIYKTTDKEFIIYPIDELGNKINTALDGTVKIDLANKVTGKKNIIADQVQINNNSFYKFYVKSNSLEDYKINVLFTSKEKTLFLSKNLKTELFIDYSTNSQYGKSIEYLNNKDIVKGNNGFLKPNDKITRAEIITTLVRIKNGDGVELFKKEMNEYIKKNGKFFKDINGNEWYAPYIFMGFKNGIIKGSEGKAYPNEIIVKAELLALYGRSFGVSENNLFTNWLDIKDDDRFKQYADPGKKYNLFPFDNKYYFNGFEQVSRIDSFESLYRYMTTNINIKHTSANIINNKNNDSNNIKLNNQNQPKKENTDQLEEIIRGLIKN